MCGTPYPSRRTVTSYSPVPDRSRRPSSVHEATRSIRRSRPVPRARLVLVMARRLSPGPELHPDPAVSATGIFDGPRGRILGAPEEVPMFSLAGKSCVVTGASRGLGRAIALAFAEQGADVVLAARSVPDLEQLRTEIEARGRRAVV